MKPPDTTLDALILVQEIFPNEELADMGTETYYSCCGKSICGGCIHSVIMSGNDKKCPFCNAERMGKTDEERVEEFIKRVEVNDAGATYVLGSNYYHGQLGLQQDWEREMELCKQAAALGSSQSHFHLVGGVPQKMSFFQMVRKSFLSDQTYST